MNIKSVPQSAGVNAVKESGEGQRQATDRESKKNKPAKNTATAETAKATEATPEDGDATLRASQPTDTQTVVDLLSHPVKPKTTAKFPTPRKLSPEAASAKKLNRNA